MKTIHELLGMPLVAVAEGVRLGTLRGLDFDAADGQIRGLHFAGAAGRADGVLPWSAVVAVGADAITIESLNRLVEQLGKWVGGEHVHRPRAAVPSYPLARMHRAFPGAV